MACVTIRFLMTHSLWFTSDYAEPLSERILSISWHSVMYLFTWKMFMTKAHKQEISFDIWSSRTRSWWDGSISGVFESIGKKLQLSSPRLYAHTKCVHVKCILLHIRYKVCTVNRIPVWYWKYIYILHYRFQMFRFCQMQQNWCLWINKEHCFLL